VPADLEKLLGDAKFGEVRKLVEGGLPLTTRVGDSKESLLQAAIWQGREGQEEFVTWLLERGADPNAASDTGRTALHVAARQREPEIVRALLAHGANPDTAEKSGRTALHMAANAGIAALLLEKGADPRKLDDEGRSPLFSPAIAMDTPLLALLLEKGADPNTRLPDDGWTPLHYAIEHSVMEKAKCVGLLLKAGAKANVADDDGVTPLHLAVEQGSEGAVSLLLAAGADARAKTTRAVKWNYFEHPKGTTPLDAVKGKPKIAALLKAAGAAPSAPATGIALVQRKGDWKCVLPLAGTKKADLSKTLAAMTSVMKDVERLVFRNPDYGTEDRLVSFELAPAKGKPWDESRFFGACAKEPSLHAPIAAFVKAVIAANADDTVYAHEELEEGTDAIRALLLAKAKGALALYLAFLDSIDLDHTVEQPAVVRAIRKLYPAKQLRPILDLLKQNGVEL
jgi:ankyrin repeat protein